MEFHGIFSEILQGEFMGTARFSMKKHGKRWSSTEFKKQSLEFCFTNDKKRGRFQETGDEWRLEVGC